MLAIQKQASNSFMALLSLPATAMGFALSIQISALSWLLSTKYGLDIHEVGIVWAAGPIAGIIGQPIVGAISDNIWFWKGRRRPFIWIGGFLAALMLLALPNIGIISSALGFDGIIGVAITVALTLDLAINVSFNPTRSIIADVTTVENRTKGYTWMQFISGFFGVAAYLIGAMLNKYLLIYVGVGLVLLFSIIPPLFIEEPRELESSDESNASTASKSVSTLEIINTLQPLWGFIIFGVYKIFIKLGGIEVNHHYVEIACGLLTIAMFAKVFLAGARSENNMLEFQKVMAAHALTWLGVQSMFVYTYAYIQNEIPNMTDDSTGFTIDISFLILNLVGFLLPVLALEPLTKKIGRVRTHTICIAIMAVSYAGIAMVGKSVISLYVLMAFAGVGWAATVSLVFAIMSVRIDQSRMGLYMGIFNLSVVLPQLVASLQVGDIVQASADKSMIFWICSASLAGSAILWLFVRENNDVKLEASIDQDDPTVLDNLGLNES